MKTAAFLGRTGFALLLFLLATVAPAARADAGVAPPALQKATLAAGCFWSMEAIYSQLKGVVKVVPGYAGGTTPNPTYGQVETGTTGYAESIEITYQPNTISFSQLVKVMLTTRNPTTLNSQPPDDGPQYRSIIFYRNQAQAKAARAVIRGITAAHLWPSPIVTRVAPLTHFYPAEAYHVDYYKNHPDQPYCAEVIRPEIERFRSQFKSLLKN